MACPPALENPHHIVTAVLEMAAASSSYGQIADRLGLTRSRVAGIVSRAKKADPFKPVSKFSRVGHSKYSDPRLVELAEKRERIVLEQRMRIASSREMRVLAKRAREKQRYNERVAKQAEERAAIRRQFLALDERTRLRKEAETLGSLNVSFMDLERGQCRYPTTHRPPHLFCALPAEPHTPYCRCHGAVAYRGDGK